MIPGFNTDIKFRGNMYHVQTQDKGVHNPKIETLVYKKGVILDTRVVSYADILQSDCLEDVVTEVMDLQHQEAIGAVRDGKYYDDDDTDVSILRTMIKESFERMIIKHKRAGS